MQLPASLLMMGKQLNITQLGFIEKVKSPVRLNPAYRIYYTDSARQGGSHQVNFFETVEDLVFVFL